MNPFAWWGRVAVCHYQMILILMKDPPKKHWTFFDYQIPVADSNINHMLYIFYFLQYLTQTRLL